MIATATTEHNKLCLKSCVVHSVVKLLYAEIRSIKIESNLVFW